MKGVPLLQMRQVRKAAIRQHELDHTLTAFMYKFNLPIPVVWLIAQFYRKEFIWYVPDLTLPFMCFHYDMKRYVQWLLAECHRQLELNKTIEEACYGREYLTKGQIKSFRAQQPLVHAFITELFDTEMFPPDPPGSHPENTTYIPWSYHAKRPVESTRLMGCRRGYSAWWGLPVDDEPYMEWPSRESRTEYWDRRLAYRTRERRHNERVRAQGLRARWPHHVSDTEATEFLKEMAIPTLERQCKRIENYTTWVLSHCRQPRDTVTWVLDPRVFPLPPDPQASAPKVLVVEHNLWKNPLYGIRGVPSGKFPRNDTVWNFTELMGWDPTVYISWFRTEDGGGFPFSQRDIIRPRAKRSVKYPNALKPVVDGLGCWPNLLPELTPGTYARFTHSARAMTRIDDRVEHPLPALCKN